MGLITGYNHGDFISADLIYSKIKREFKSFASVNLLDDMDFPAYTMEVLRKLGNGAMRESEAVTFIHNQQAALPKDFSQLHAAYRCSNNAMNHVPKKLLQNKMIFEDDITNEVLCRTNNCLIDCHADDKIISRIIVRKFINEDLVNFEFGHLGLLKLSPNVRQHSEHTPNTIHQHHSNEITINDGFIFTNFKDDAIFLQYYAFPYDENGLPMIPANVETEKAVEWGIKYQLLLNFWLVDDLSNSLNKWQKAEQEAEKWFAEAKHLNKLPAFSTFVNQNRNARGINKLQAFSHNNRQW